MNLEKTDFASGTAVDAGSFYKRYARALRLYAQRRFRVDRERAEELVAEFVAHTVSRARDERAVFEIYDETRGRFRDYLVVAFQRSCIRLLAREAKRDHLPFDAVAEPGDDEADALRALLDLETSERVRAAVGWAREQVLRSLAWTEVERACLELVASPCASLSERQALAAGRTLARAGLLRPKGGGSRDEALRAAVRSVVEGIRRKLAERRFVELKLPEEPLNGFPTDAAVGQALTEEGLLEPKSSEEAFRSAAKRIGTRVRLKLLAALEQALNEAAVRAHPDGVPGDEPERARRVFEHVFAVLEAMGARTERADLES